MGESQAVCSWAFAQSGAGGGGGRVRRGGCKADVSGRHRGARDEAFTKAVTDKHSRVPWRAGDVCALLGEAQGCF